MVKIVTNKHTLICQSVKHIFAEIILTQKIYKIALNCKIKYHSILIDVQAFVL